MQLEVNGIGNVDNKQNFSRNFLKVEKPYQRTGNNLNKTETEIFRMQNEDTKETNFLRRSDCMRFNDYAKRGGEEEDQSIPEKKNGQLK